MLRHRLISLINWHRHGRCLFPVLCMYDDLILAEEYGLKRARWRDARHLRQQLDEMAKNMSEAGGFSGEDPPAS